MEKLDYGHNSKIKTFNDFDQIPKDIKFDLIYTFDVLEHVSNPYKLNKDIINFCNQDTIIIHSIDLTSHYHGNNTINAFKHYLYNDNLWKLMTSNRSSFTNRIRSQEWHQLFEKFFHVIVFEEIDHPLKEKILHKFKLLRNNDTISRVNVSMRAR